MERRKVGAPFCQQWQELSDFKEAAGPSVDKQQRNGVLHVRSLMDKVDIQVAELIRCDRVREHRHAI